MIIKNDIYKFEQKYVHDTARKFWNTDRYNYRRIMLSKLYAKSPYFLYNVMIKIKDEDEK